MTYALEYEVPGDAAIYGRVKSEIGTDQPEGIVVHLVVKTERGLRHIEVWDSRQAWETFRDGRVRPAVDKVLTAIGFEQLPPPPAEEPIDVVDVWT
jgi:hypothetical protein